MQCPMPFLFGRPGYFKLVIINPDLNIRINHLAQGSQRTLHFNAVIGVNRDGNSFGQCNR
jgi:hypothetical protein